jgi:hypothetical protein
MRSESEEMEPDANDREWPPAIKEAKVFRGP